MLAETVEGWTKQWKQEVWQEGEHALLHKVLERRLGPLPEWVRE